MSFEVRLIEDAAGLQAILTSLKELPNEVAQRIERKAMKRALQPLYDEAVRRAPVGDTGNLANGIRIRFRIGGKTLYGEVATTAPHSHLVEYGHRIVHGPRGGRQTVSKERVPPHPFFRPAVFGKEEQILKIIEEEVDLAIKRFEKRSSRA